MPCIYGNISGLHSWKSTLVCVYLKSLCIQGRTMNQAFYFHRIANPNIILSFNARTFLFDCPNASKAVYEINFYLMTLFPQCYFIKLSKEWTSPNFAFHYYSKTLFFLWVNQKIKFLPDPTIEHDFNLKLYILTHTRMHSIMHARTQARTHAYTHARTHTPF